MLSTPFTQHQAFLLYPAVAPGSGTISASDTPTLQPFIAPAESKPTGASVIVCPGGGYAVLAGHEGAPVAQWLNEHGISAFVLRYRVAPHHHPVPLSDAQRAMRFVRHHAGVWGLDAKRVGILGFSAGGHLAATAAVHYETARPEAADPLDRPATRPDAQVLIYPFLAMKERTHPGCRANLVGENPSPELLDYLTNEAHINRQTPPAFVFHSTVDGVVPVEPTDSYVAKLKAHRVPHAYVRGEYGAHGIGVHEWWAPACIQFLREQGF